MTDPIPSRRTLMAGAAASLAASSAWSASDTESWPSRPITILIGFGAGGVIDVGARLLAEGLRPLLPQPIIIENRPGASGMVAAAAAARAAPDGHTLIGVPGTLTIVPSVMKQVPIDVLRDLQPITIFATSPNVLVVTPDFPARTLQEFLTLVRARPAEDVAYASSGVGTTVHLMAGMVERAAGVRLRHVPYRSSSESIQAVVAGHVPAVFSALNSALPFIQARSVRALAVASERRTAFLPGMPTFDESGLAGVRSETWLGLAAGSGVSRPIVDRLAVLCREVMRGPGMQAKLAALGAETLDIGPDAAREQMRREVGAFAELAREMGIKPQD